MSGGASAWAAFRALVRWDWRREMHGKSTLVSMAVMGVTTLFLFSFAVPPQSVSIEDTRAGILWITFLLAATIGIDRAFRADGESGVLEGLLLTPVPRAVVYYGRVVGTTLLVLLLQTLLFVLFLVLFDQSLSADALLPLVVSVVAVDLAFVAAGVLVAAMTWSVPGGDVLMRVLLFPLLIPVFAMAVAVARDAFDGRPVSLGIVASLIAVDLVFLGAGHMLFEHLVDDVSGEA